MQGKRAKLIQRATATIGRNRLISSVTAVGTLNSTPSALRCQATVAAMLASGAVPARRTLRTARATQRSTRRRPRHPRTQRGPNAPAPSIIAPRSRASGLLCCARRCSPAHRHAARQSTCSASSCKMMCALRAQVSACRLHSSSKHATSREVSAGVSTDRNRRLRCRCASPSSCCTLPRPCNKRSVVGGIAPTRVKRPG